MLLAAVVKTKIERFRETQRSTRVDGLTGLLNHTASKAHLRGMVKNTSVHRALTVAMIDIDHFKIANDTHGYPLGDRVIKSLALFLKRRLRKSDHIGRLGGEEIAVILPDTDIANACKVLDDIRSRFAEINFSSEEPDLHCTFSCGIADLQEGMDVKQLARSADDALWKAKNAGRNQVICSIAEDN